MPHIRAVAVRTPFGDAQTTFAALGRGSGATTPLPNDLMQGLIDLAAPLVQGMKPDLVVFATTKGDLDLWCDDLFSPQSIGIGGPAWCAARLSGAFACPAFTVSAACASSTAALGVAARRIAAGAAQRVMVVAAERPTAFIHDGFACLRAIDPDGCRPFHAQRAGLMPGAALAAIVLERSGDGPWLSGWGAHMDATHLTGPDRTGGGLAATCQQALQRASCNAPATVIAHGTGTRYNDDAESLAYQSICPDAHITGFKGLLGHSLGACGLVDVALAIEAYRTQRIPGTVGTNTPGCSGVIHLLPPGLHNLTPGPILVANAGFGGINAAVVLSNVAPQPPRRVTAQCAQRVTLDHVGWTSDGIFTAWTEPGQPGALPRLGAADVLGHSDVSWGRLDLPSRALVALGCRLGPLADTTAVVLLSDTGCAASDRAFAAGRRTGNPDPQRFPYTLPTAAIGELSIRQRVRGAGLCLQGASDEQGRAIVADLLADGTPTVVLARVEADRPPHVAWAERWTSG